MFEQSASIALLLYLIFASPQAFAKKVDLTSGAPITIGFVAGAEWAPHSGLVSGTKSSSSAYSHYYLFQFSYDLVKFAFQPYAGWHFYPTQKGKAPNYLDTSQGGGLSYGLRVLLAPFVSENKRSRFYVAASMGVATAKLRNARSYKDAAGNTTTVNTELVSGTGTESSAGAGVEFFLLQNYTLLIEGGYTDRSIEGFSYLSNVDVTGTTRSEGAEVLDEQGRKKGFHVWSPYAQVALNLHF